MAERPSGERTEEPTLKRKQDARKRGQVARSQEVTGAATVLVLALTLPLVIGALAESLRTSLMYLLTSASQRDAGHLIDLLASATMVAVSKTWPILLIVLVTGLAANVLQVGFLASSEAVTPKFERVNPITGFQRLFSKRGLFEGLKAILKLGLFSLVVGMTVYEHWESIVLIGHASVSTAGEVMMNLVYDIFIRIGILWAMIATGDFFFQRYELRQQLMMTKEEVRREMKEQEVSHELKMAQAQRRRKYAKGGLTSQVNAADVLITNPTHLSVAIVYDRTKMHAPLVIAKGQELIALKMREIAKAGKVPIVENKPLAKALYMQCEPGDFVPRDLFTPVAEVLAFVYRTMKKVKK